MYPLHPFTVHFPIALLLTGGLFTLLYVRNGQRALEQSAFYCLVVGWCGALLATLSGAIDALQQVAGPEAAHRDALGWVNAHAALGVAIVLVYGRALLLRRRRPTIVDDLAQREGYFWLLIVGSLLVVVDGWLGGYLVYSRGLGVR